MKAFLCHSSVDKNYELGEFDRAASELDTLDSRFRVDPRSNDVRVGLRCKLLIREQKWWLAEQVSAHISNQGTPQYQALRLDILAQKVKDPGVSPGDRETALKEKESLERRGVAPKRLLTEADAPDAEEAGDDQTERDTDPASK